MNQKPLYGLPVAWIVREVPDGRWGPLSELDPLRGPVAPCGLSAGLCAPLGQHGPACCAGELVSHLSLDLGLQLVLDGPFELGQGVGLFGRKALGV